MRLSEAEYVALLAQRGQPQSRAKKPRQTAPQKAYDAINLPTAEPPAFIDLHNLPLLPLPSERGRKAWTPRKKAAFRRSLQKSIIAELGGAWKFRPYLMAYIGVVRFTSNPRVDPDNLIASCKELLDVLQVPSATCPDGLGIIRDDSGQYHTLTCRVMKTAPGNGRTEVDIYGI